MGLMVGARLKALAHVVKHWRTWPQHRIWRMYRYFGFDTQAVCCECGAVFGAKDHLALARTMTFLNWRKHAREQR